MYSVQQAANFSLKMSAALLLLFLAAAAHHRSDLDHSCSDPEKRCTLRNFVLHSDEDLNAVTFPAFPHPLTIESGTITHFSRQLAEELADVVDLTVNGLEMETLYVKPEMTSLEASNNRIYALLVDSDNPSRAYNIQSLNLTGNELTNVTVLKRFTEMRYLHLDGNKLVNLSMDVFSGMAELRELSIANNELTHVDTKNSLQLVMLRTLSFAGNKLEELVVKNWELESLKILDLSRSKLHQLIGGFKRFASLQIAKIAGNLWECETLSGLDSFEQLELDTDESGRCDNEGMISFHEVCCTVYVYTGKELELFEDKWKEIQQLQDTVTKLSVFIDDVKRSDSATETSEQTLEERMQELENQMKSVWNKLNEQDESAIEEKIQELTQLISDHKETVDALESKQEGSESRLDDLEKQISSLQQTMDEKLQAVDTVKERVEKLEEQLIRSDGVESVQKSVTALKKAVKRLESQQNKYHLFGLSLKSQIVKERSNVESVQQSFHKLSKEMKELLDKVNKEESKINRTS